MRRIRDLLILMGLTGFGQGATKTPLLLDDEEAVAIAVGLNQAASGDIVETKESSLWALAKLEQILPSRLKRRVAAPRMFSARVSFDSHGSQANAETLSLFEIACRDREKPRRAHLRHTGLESKRIVQPHRLVNWGCRWYLVAGASQQADIQS